MGKLGRNILPLSEARNQVDWPENMIFSLKKFKDLDELLWNVRKISVWFYRISSPKF